jgi:cell division protein FtsQ
MKKGIKILSWSAFTLVVLILLVFVDNSYSAIPCAAPQISIVQEDGHHFITEKSVIEQLSNIGYSLIGQQFKDIEVSRIEEVIESTPGVKNAEVYKLNNGSLTLEINQSRPIARVITDNGLVSFYLDADGNTMPLSKSYIARVPVFSGSIYNADGNFKNVFEIKANDSLKAIHLLDDIFDVASALDKNEFIKLQTLQVFVTDKNEFEITPRVGKNRILLGTAENIESKLSKLTQFYTAVIQPQELNNYDTISVKYSNQIVCSKR